MRTGKRRVVYKLLKCLFPLFQLLLISLLPVANPVYASPDPSDGWWTCRPTDHTITGVSVTFPGRAYDGDTNTFALFAYSGITGSFEVKSFRLRPLVLYYLDSVDFNIRFKTTASTNTRANDYWQIVYYVAPSSTATVLMVGDPLVSVPIGTYVNASQPEPNDGVWSWTDVSNIRFVVETIRVGGADSPAGNFYEYEAWATVYYHYSSLYVDPPSMNVTTGQWFTIDVNATDVCNLYGWEFKLSYDKAVLTATSVAEGPFLNQSGAKTSTFTVVEVNDVIGRVWAGCSLMGDVLATTGTTGVLATVNFTVDTRGTSLLDLHGTKLSGYNYTSKNTFRISHTAFDGSFDNRLPSVPEFPLGAAIEIALASVIVYIWWKRRRKIKTIPAQGSSLAHTK